MRQTGIEVARSMDGLQEIRDKSKIREFLIAYAIHNDINIDPSVTPWCSAFINACERASGALTAGKLNARSWLEYGKTVLKKDAKEGDIIIFARGSNNWEGHVTYLVSFDDKNHIVNVFGGNQSDQVCLRAYSQDRILGIRRG